MTETSQRQDLLVFFRTAGAFWSGASAPSAWIWTGLLVLLVGGQMAIQVLWTAWGGWFYDALQSREAARVLDILPFIPVIVLGFMVCVTGLLVGRMRLQLAWRGRLTETLVGRWLGNQAYFRLTQGAFAEGTPEYRIAEDVRLVVEPMVELAVGLLTAVLGAVVFAQVLWQVGGTLHVNVAGVAFGVPGYLAIAALVYAVVVTMITLRAGQNLSCRVAARQDAEAKFRAELTRLRENAESIALHQGDAAERMAVTRRYGAITRAWAQMIRCSGFVGLATNGNIALSPVIPMLLAVPGYFDGQLTIGNVAQIVGAFAATQTAAAWLADNYLRVSDVMGSVTRVAELIRALDDSETTAKTITLQQGETDIVVEGVQLHLPDGSALGQPIDLHIQPGERVLLTGPSGSGKSTLVRALAGLWRWGNGHITMPKGQVMFIPQRIFLPNAPLRDVARYATNATPDDATLITLMHETGLSHLTDRLNETARWDTILSGGERQRIAFLRALIAKPSLIVMDESTSALDETAQASLMKTLIKTLPTTTLLSIAHRPSLRPFHTREVVLGGLASKRWALPRPARGGASGHHSFKKVLERGGGHTRRVVPHVVPDPLLSPKPA